MDFEVPEPVRLHIYRVFSDANDKVTGRLSLAPNISEESLDLSLIDALAEHAAPKIVSQGWAVRFAAHFIGRLRHYGRYEVADIGIVIEFKDGENVVARKLLLLQSKRLYPKNNDVVEFDDFDYRLGLGMITRADSIEASVFADVEYEFDQDCAYEMLKAGSQQCSAIDQHSDHSGVPVHYMLYNPVVLPWLIRYPQDRVQLDLPTREIGARVLAATEVHHLLREKRERASLKFAELIDGKDARRCGLTLEDFIDEAVACREGYLYEHGRDRGIERLFERKSGPIFCVIEIVIERSRD